MRVRDETMTNYVCNSPLDGLMCWVTVRPYNNCAVLLYGASIPASYAQKNMSAVSSRAVARYVFLQL